MARTSLLPGLLKTLGSNKDAPLPVDLFEVSDVVLLDEASAVGARNCRRLAAIHAGPAAAFEIVHGLLDRVMEVLPVPFLAGGKAEADAGKKGYYLLPSDADGAYFKGRQASDERSRGARERAKRGKGVCRVMGSPARTL